MNFINPTINGRSTIYLYDQRTGGKGGNEVCSLRWKNLTEVMQGRDANNQPQPLYHVSVLDNCTGQNKSNTSFKFEALQTTLGLFKAKTKLFLKPGHSHNQSDVITGESTRFLIKKDLFTIDQLAVEMNKCPKVNVTVLNSDSFYEWESFLDKFFRDLPPGFSKYYCFEIVDGSISMKRLCSESESDNDGKHKDLLRDPLNGRKAILQELFGLPPDASRKDIINAKILLPNAPRKELTDAKLESISKKFSCIPKEYLSYYPGGDDFLKKQNSSETVQEEIPGNEGSLVAMKPKKGRPKAPVKTPKNTQSIVKFLCSPVIPRTSSTSKDIVPFGSRTLSLDPSNNNYLTGGNSFQLGNVIDLSKEDNGWKAQKEGPEGVSRNEEDNGRKNQKRRPDGVRRNEEDNGRKNQKGKQGGFVDNCSDEASDEDEAVIKFPVAKTYSQLDDIF